MQSIITFNECYKVPLKEGVNVGPSARWPSATWTTVFRLLTRAGILLCATAIRRTPILTQPQTRWVPGGAPFRGEKRRRFETDHALSCSSGFNNVEIFTCTSPVFMSQCLNSGINLPFIHFTVQYLQLTNYRA
jgi:hypothetical protein